jgi:ATP-dependent DNA helicase RecG
MRIRVAIYADRLEVENPGMLPFGMTLDDFKAGVSRIRNRVIVRAMRELELLEKWGTGYRRVLQACEEGGYPEPVWQELGTALRVVFRPHPNVIDEGSMSTNVPVNVPVNERQRWILDQLQHGQALRADAIAAHFGVAEKTAKRDLAALKAHALIQFVGPPKTGSYRLVSQS